MNDKTGWIDVIGGFIDNGIEGIGLVESGTED